MNPEIISIGELLVEIMRTERNVPHGIVGSVYKGPFPSGAPAIFIDSAARMSSSFNFSTGFIGTVGKDEFGEAIIEKLKNDNVDVSKIKVIDNKTTGIAFNQYNSDGSRKFIFAAGAAGQISPNDLERDYFTNIKALHIMGSSLSISESSRESCYRAIKIAKSINPKTLISFDPNLRPEMLDLKTILKISKPILENTTILFPSGEEAEMLAGVKGETKACKKLLDNGIKLVVLKQGKEGCTIFSSGIVDVIKVPGYKVEEIDPTGAGDSFDGAFVVCYLAGWDLKKIGMFANAAGALKVQCFGPMPNTSNDEVIELMSKKT
ncbi:MAG: sugar kinase [Candidatus Lokiarchaeota archaeon]|nr:sugar kinase [Candidatus Lokiarchaeota archaeon]